MPYFILRSARDKDLRIQKCCVLRHELSPDSERDIILNLDGKLFGIECAIPLTPVQAMNQLETLGYQCVGMSHAEPGVFFWTIQTPRSIPAPKFPEVKLTKPRTLALPSKKLVVREESIAESDNEDPSGSESHDDEADSVSRVTTISTKSSTPSNSTNSTTKSTSKKDKKLKKSAKK